MPLYVLWLVSKVGLLGVLAHLVRQKEGTRESGSVAQKPWVGQRGSLLYEFARSAKKNKKRLFLQNWLFTAFQQHDLVARSNSSRLYSFSKLFFA